MAEHLLADVQHQLAGANWQRGGGKGAKPKRVPSPAERRQKELAEEAKRERALARARAWERGHQERAATTR